MKPIKAIGLLAVFTGIVSCISVLGFTPVTFVCSLLGVACSAIAWKGGHRWLAGIGLGLSLLGSGLLLAVLYSFGWLGSA